MSVRLTWLGHSSLVLDIGPTRLLVDPLLGRHAGLLRRRGPVPRLEQWEGAAATLVSHLHHDHAELRSLRQAGAPVLTAPANARFLHRRTVPAAGLSDADWHTVPGTAIEVRLTRADHGRRPMPHRPNAAHGHLVRAPGITLWIAGDTALYDELEELPAVAGGIDVAVVPVGGWGPRLSGGHMGPVDAARAARLVGAAVAVPYHFGTLHLPGTAGAWMEASGSAFVEQLELPGSNPRPVRLRPGAVWEP